MTDQFLWLSGGEWTAIAAMAQVLAAIGALALLLITWLSQRDTRDAIEASRTLALQTEALVRAARDGQELASLPVIEVVHESHNNRLRLTNKGNGPLLAPRVSDDSGELQLVSQDDPGLAYVQAAAIAVADNSYALLVAGKPPSGELNVRGVTLPGTTFSATLDCAGFAGRAALVARSSRNASERTG